MILCYWRVGFLLSPSSADPDVVTVAHRTSTVIDYDRLIIMDKGEFRQDSHDIACFA
jgi:ABC-type transport system involved in Fe-S cluster assembly fused permease/ATPase subunit